MPGMDETVGAAGELTLFSRHAEVTVDIGRGAISSIRACDAGTGLVEVARLVDAGLEPLIGSFGCGWTLMSTGRLDGGWACRLVRGAQAGALRQRRIVRVGPDRGIWLYDWVSNDSGNGIDLKRGLVLEAASGFSWIDPGKDVAYDDQTRDEDVALWARGTAASERAEYEAREHLAPGQEMSYRLVACPAADQRAVAERPRPRLLGEGAPSSIDVRSSGPMP